MFLRRVSQFIQRSFAPKFRAGSRPLVTRLLEPHFEEKSNTKPSKFSAHHTTPHLAVSGLTGLKSLGGLSLLSYMAIEATEGHFQMLKTWNVDLARDLSTALDRTEELEIMVQDLTNFIETQKNEISRLKDMIRRQ